jgi:phenylalanyl-tRNA synthetase beta chain
VTNYVLLETGQPLHVFDARRLGGAEIVVRPAAEGERMTTLDGKERTLDRRILVIADASKPVVIAGVMGGTESGVSETTTDLVLEGACFRRQSVRWTSRHLGLSTDSSYRYERGVDPHSLLEAVWRAIDLILETAGGSITGPSFRIGGDVPWKREIVTTEAYLRERLGFDLPAAEMRASLEALEMEITREEKTPARGLAWTVSVPSWRDDLDRPIDLVEEVLRLHGTDKIPTATVISNGLVAEDSPVVAFNRRVTEYLVGHDFHECVNYTLRSAHEAAAWASAGAVDGFALANPFVEDQSHLRSTLVGGLLDALKLNQSRGVPAARLFETGRVFIESAGANLECCGVGFIMAEQSGERFWLRREPIDFYGVKHHLQALTAEAGIEFADGAISAVTQSTYGWQAGHAAQAGGIGNGWVASLGLLDLAMVRGLGITGKVFAGMLWVLPERLPAQMKRIRFEPFGEFPPTRRDLAIVADKNVSSSTAATFITSAIPGLPLAPDIRLLVGPVFDHFDKLPGNLQSFAFPLTFVSGQRTLTDADVNEAIKKLHESVAQSGIYKIRT